MERVCVGCGVRKDCESEGDTQRGRQGVFPIEMHRQTSQQIVEQDLILKVIPNIVLSLSFSNCFSTWNLWPGNIVSRYKHMSFQVSFIVDMAPCIFGYEEYSLAKIWRTVTLHCLTQRETMRINTCSLSRSIWYCQRVKMDYAYIQDSTVIIFSLWKLGHQSIQFSTNIHKSERDPWLVKF